MELNSTPVRQYKPLLMDVNKTWTKEEFLEDLPRWLKSGVEFDSQREVARFYGIKYQTLHDWVKDAPICRTRIGRRKVVAA